MKLNRQLFAYLLVICLLVCVLPVPYAAARQGDGELDAEYGEAKYSYIALDAYSRMPSFHDGAIIVTNEDGRTGLVNAKEEEILPFQYNGLHYLSENRYIFYTDESDGIINTDGEVLLRFSGWDMQNGILCVYDDYSDFSTYSYYTMDLQPSNRAAYMGVKTIPSALKNIKEWDYHPNKKHPEFDYYTIYVGKQRGVLNANFKAIIPLQDYDTYNLASDGVKPIFRVGNYTAGYGLTTYDGDVLFPVGTFKEVWSYADNALKVQSDSQCGVIDYSGKWLVPMGEYKGLGYINPDGYISAVNYDGSYSQLTNITSKLYKNGVLERTITGKRIETTSSHRYLRFTSDGALFGFMDATGTVILSESYKGVYQFDSKTFIAYEQDNDKRYQYTLLDENLHPIFDHYRSISHWSDDLYLVYDGEFYGIRRLDGGYLFPMQYKSIRYLSEDLCLISDGELYGVRRLNGESVLPMRYKSISRLSDDAYVVWDGNSCGIKQTNGDYTILPVYPVYQATGSLSLLELYDGESYSIVDRISNNILVSQVPNRLTLEEYWRSWGYYLGGLEEAKGYAMSINGYNGSVFAFTSGDYWDDNGVTTYYINCDTPAFMGKLSCNASNITEDGLFAYWNADSDTYGFGRLKGKRPWDSQQNPVTSNGKITNLYPESNKVLNLDDPSKGTSATNYLDAKPRIFFDRAVDSYAGRAKLDFSNGTLEIRRSSDDGLVYSVKESAGNPGTSNQMPIWGEASPYTAVRLEDAVSVLDYETEYYVVMPEGFVKFSDGTASPAVKKGDWTFKTAKAPVYRVVQMEEFGDLSVNSSGVAIAWFRIEDENGNPISGATLQYQLNGATAKTVISDGNGLVSVETPRLEKTQEFHVAFSAYKNNLRGIRDIPIVNGEQDFTVTVKALSYTREWSGTLNTGIGLSEGIGAGIKGGAAKAEAHLIQRSMSGDAAQSFSISDEYDDTQRTLTLKTSNSNAQKLKLKSGVDTNILGNTELKIVGASGNVKYTNELESGLKIGNYDPQNTEQLKQIGAFTLIGVAGSNQSAYLQSLIGLLNPNICNTTSAKSSAALSAEASVLEFEVGISEKSNLNASVASGKGSTVWSWFSSYDSSDHTLDLVKSLKAEVSAGIGSVGIGSKKSETPVSRIIADFNTGDYLKGYSVEGSRSITATHDTKEGKVKGISYKAYLEGESHASLYENATDISVKVSFDEEQTQELLKENAALSLFSKGLNPAINIQDAIRAMHDSGLIAKVTETTELKEGFNFDFPLGVELIIGLEFSFSLSGEMSGSYVDMTAVRYAGNDYVTSIAMIPETYIKANLSDLTALLAEPLKNILSDLKGQVASAVDAVRDGVSNAYAKVSGRVASWYASIASIPTAELHSMGIMTLMSGNEPDSNAAVSATLGSPYLISIYADETKETLVTNEQLAEHPLTLTLAYTDEMLSLAGASSDSNVMLFSFDSERNLYVYESGGVQDKAQKTVTAQITKNGEYILATDSVAPIITDFKMENQTLTPTLTVLISDLSGLGNFRFWIDNGNDLVTMENIKDHYNSSTGVFTYEFASALSEGTHTASFLATDNLGNANASPVSFTFEAHPLRGTISITQFPTSAITNRGAFTVKAKSSGVESFSQVNLRCNTGSQILSVLPMTWENDAWTVQVTPVDGAESLALTAIAEDSWGNTITSDSVTVTLNLPRQLEDVQIQNVVYDQGVAQVTVQAPQGLAISGTLFVGVYQNGRQLCIGSGNIGLASGQSNTVPVVLPNFGTEATTIKAFMLSPDEFIPLCAAYTLQL